MEFQQCAKDEKSKLWFMSKLPLGLVVLLIIFGFYTVATATNSGERVINIQSGSANLLNPFNLTSAGSNGDLSATRGMFFPPVHCPYRPTVRSPWGPWTPIVPKPIFPWWPATPTMPANPNFPWWPQRHLTVPPRFNWLFE